MPFFPVWLAYKGLNASEIGVMLAVPMVVRLFCVPLITRLADRFNMLRGAIIIASIGSLAGHLAMVAMNGFVPLVIAMAIAAVCFTPTYPLTDAYALRGLAERSKAYGPVRLWSSAFFILANIGGGILFGIIAPSHIIWLIMSGYVFGIVLSWLMVPLKPHHEVTADVPPARSLWRMPVFVAVTLAFGLIQSSHAMYYGFSTLDWTARGLSGGTIGTLWAIGVIAEIVLFAYSATVARFVSPLMLIVIGGVGGVVRWTAMAFDPPLALLPVLQCLHALTFCATHVGAMMFIGQFVPVGRAATAQGDLSAAQSLIFAVVMGLSGVLFTRFGTFAYAAMVVPAAFGALVAVFAVVRWRSAQADGPSPTTPVPADR